MAYTSLKRNRFNIFRPITYTATLVSLALLSSQTLAQRAEIDGKEIPDLDGAERGDVSRAPGNSDLENKIPTESNQGINKARENIKENRPDEDNVFLKIEGMEGDSTR